MVLLLSCGGASDGDVRHLFDGSERDGKKSVILTAKQPNGQHCFYGGEIAGEEMLKSSSMEKLVQGSARLTPRSLAYQDVARVLLADTKASNVVSHLRVNSFTTALSLTCLVSSIIFISTNLALAISIKGHRVPLQRILTGKIAAASCGAEMALAAGGWLIGRNSAKASNLTSRKLISAHLYDTSAAELERLRKIFSWLESRDAMQCPATLQLPTTSKVQRLRPA